MAKRHSQFVCTRCGAVQIRWMGKCPDCGEWNCLEEQTVEREVEDRHRPVAMTLGAGPGDLTEPDDDDETLGGGPGPGDVATFGEPGVGASGRTAIPMGEIRSDATRRMVTGIAEFDRVLGGGLVPGSAVLIGGDPGIGKSTLLLQVGDALARHPTSHPVLFVTSEESLGQIRLRAERMGLADSPMLVAAQANLNIICNLIRKQKPSVVVMDSIQMAYRPEMTASPGSVAQLRDSAGRLVWLAKQMGFALILVGHVTKEGSIAGPKILEHIVDCVAYFEGDRFHAHRLIRAVKNRYGSTDELGIFEMTGEGLLPVADPSKLFLQTQRAARPGSVVLAACEGTRTLLVEVQALCAQSVFGAAKRKATGVDSARVAMILAVIEKHCECVLGDQDVFVNVVGGVRVTEPAADLAIALAVLGAMTNRSLAESTVVCGELGLGAELRPTHHQHQRIAEAARVGFKRFILPQNPPLAASRAPTPADSHQPEGDPKPAIQIHSCGSLTDAARHLG